VSTESTLCFTINRKSTEGLQTAMKYRPVTDERTLIRFKHYGSKHCLQLGEDDMVTWIGKGFAVCISVSQTFFYGGIPKSNFSYPQETLLMKTLTAGKQKAVGSTRRLLQYCQFAEQKFPRYFKGSSEFFAVYEEFYVFIPRFFTVTLSIFQGFVLGKRWPSPWSEGKV